MRTRYIMNIESGLYETRTRHSLETLKPRKARGENSVTSTEKTKLWMRTRVQPRGRKVQILQTLPDTFSCYSWYQSYIIKWQHSERQGELYCLPTKMEALTIQSLPCYTIKIPLKISNFLIRSMVASILILWQMISVMLIFEFLRTISINSEKFLLFQT